MEKHRLFRARYRVNITIRPHQVPFFETTEGQGFSEGPDTFLTWGLDFIMDPLVSTQSLFTLVLLMFISQINLSPERKYNVSSSSSLTFSYG